MFVTTTYLGKQFVIYKQKFSQRIGLDEWFPTTTWKNSWSLLCSWLNTCSHHTAAGRLMYFIYSCWFEKLCVLFFTYMPNKIHYSIQNSVSYISYFPARLGICITKILSLWKIHFICPSQNSEASYYLHLNCTMYFCTGHGLWILFPSLTPARMERRNKYRDKKNSFSVHVGFSICF